MNRELTEFQIKCERALSDTLSEHSVSISERKLDGQSETYITGLIESAGIAFWIYEDGADFKTSDSQRTFEKPDYDSLEDLSSAFVGSVIENIVRAK